MFNRNRTKNRKRSRKSPAAQAQLQMESLEARQMMFAWSLSGGCVEGIGTSGPDTAILDVVGGDLFEISSNTNISNAVGLPANQISCIEVYGKGNNDFIDLRKLTAGDMPNLNSTLLHGDGKVTLNTGADTIYGSFIGDTIDGDAQGDQLYGMGGNDTIHGRLGSDRISGGAGHDTIYGDVGDDKIYGSDGNDKLYGGNGDDHICGNAGNDTIEGNLGGDKICGGDGDDNISGGLGRDTLLGNAGNDTITGGAGRDTIDGGAGADTIFAKEFPASKDTIYKDNSDWVQYSNGWFVKDNIINAASGIPCDCDEGGGTSHGGCEDDYGDAPSSYDGTSPASHKIISVGPRMGDFIDGDSGPQPSAANGDDLFDQRDDEDGITFVGGTHLHVGTTEAVQVDVQNLLPNESAKLDAWVDFNGDGQFSAGEKIANSVVVTPGVNTVSFAVPYLGAMLGPSYARFRISSAGNLGPNGPAADGEVEDYAIEIHCDHGDNPGGVDPVPIDFSTAVTGLTEVVGQGFAEQVEFLRDTVWNGVDPHELVFDLDTPVVEGRLEAPGVTVSNIHGDFGVQLEGGRIVETLDAYDGDPATGGTDGLPVLVSHPNNDAPLTIDFDTPINTFSAFIATGKEGDVNTVTVSTYGGDGGLVHTFDVNVELNEDGANREAYFAFNFGDTEIHSITIRNNNDTDYGNALVVGSLSYYRHEDTIRPSDIAGDFTGDGVVDVHDVNEAVGQVHDGLFASDDFEAYLEANESGAGDANFDRRFDTTDLVMAFQGGKFETQERANWSEGDWNGDGIFDSSDLVAAFQEGWFEV